MITIPADLAQVLDAAWGKTCRVPGFLQENEARFLGLLAACIPASGLILEIGSFKGRSTVMLASVAAHYGLGPVVAIDPHNSNLSTEHGQPVPASSYDDFLNSLRTAGVTEHVEFHHAFSTEISATWNRPIRLLWIDGDHSYAGAKADFDGFAHHLSPLGMVALHDTLNAIPGPIRVFVEDVLRSSQYGAAGFVHSIGWAQFRPEDGKKFDERRAWLARRASRLVPFATQETQLSGFRKIQYKLHRSRIPRAFLSPAEWGAILDPSSAESP
ncbi:MAG TPA: class I SAM-dependent methyltransferase [Verrucomicrobiae bacterium]|nr:class I SAM-dependent methyltransferase [Verrucomicrobiae bacterium]